MAPETSRSPRPKCTLVLSNGDHFEGELIGAPLEATGELVFTTSMVGYIESMTDPSYFGQILAFTYPLIGNYGIPRIPTELRLPIPEGFESPRVHASAVIVTVDSVDAFHWNSYQSLDLWLRDQKVPGIAGIDTRHLVHLIRQGGQLTGRVVPERAEGHRVIGRGLDTVTAAGGARVGFNPGEHEILPHVSTAERTRLTPAGGATERPRARVGVIDCGVKWNIIRQLTATHASGECEIELFPWNADFAKADVAGWVISNGPGDPARTGDLKARIAALLKQDRPVLGICLGHQLLALAAGARTEKMPYGHRSHNQPAQLVGTRRGFVTSQNHGYVVDARTLPAEWEPWFTNVNDGTIEGIRHKTRPFRSVQFHPEAAGGPKDTSWIIDEFVAEVAARCR